MKLKLVVLAVIGWVLGAGPLTAARAHCDSLDGPVVAAARRSLETGDAAPSLAWVRADAEAEVRAALASARAVRGLSNEARELADRFFFETLVRTHRDGEDAPYTGLKPAGSASAAAQAADAAIAAGSAEELSAELAHSVAGAVEAKFARVIAARARADENVETGQAFVAAYVDYVHTVEAIHAAVEGGAGRAGHHED